MTISVRRAKPEDAETIARMVAALGVITRDPRIDISVDDVLRDGFGPEPWFLGFIAESAGTTLGLAVAQRGYATDLGSRGLYITELFVEAEARGRGVGRALMRAVTEEAQALGGEWVAWDVTHDNTSAKGFYEKLGAIYRDDTVIMVLQGEALQALAGPESGGARRPAR